MMNKVKKDIIESALENLQQNLGVKGEWKPQSKMTGELDGVLELPLQTGAKKISLHTLIRRELRIYQVPGIVQLAAKKVPFLLVAQRLYPKIKEELRQNGIAYLEANGNIFIKQENIWLWIDTNKRIKIPSEKSNRAFTKTGLKVIFQLLLDGNLINETHRIIAGRTGVALGNIPQIISGLLEMGYLVKMDKKHYAYTDRKALLEKWMGLYESNLKPSLFSGTFRFRQRNDNLNGQWKDILLNTDKTQWGGEPAGDMLTNYLRPGEFTLYTVESKKELLMNYHLLPEEEGNVKVYQRFWPLKKGQGQKVVPPLLVYADLMNTHDKRCRETAEIIYHESIEPNL